MCPDEWAQVPASVLKLIEELVGRMDKLEQSVAALQTENEQLKEQLARTSKNSSQPPSKNPLTFKPWRVTAPPDCRTQVIQQQI